MRFVDTEKFWQRSLPKIRQSKFFQSWRVHEKTSVKKFSVSLDKSRRDKRTIMWEKYICTLVISLVACFKCLNHWIWDVLIFYIPRENYKELNVKIIGYSILFVSYKQVTDMYMLYILEIQGTWEKDRWRYKKINREKNKTSQKNFDAKR